MIPREPWSKSWGVLCPRDTIYLVLPSASALGDQGGELSDQELEAVAGEVGGKFTDDDVTCGRACNTDICTSLSC